jgi:CHAT domain-containing protein
VATHGFFVPKPKEGSEINRSANRGLQPDGGEEVTSYNFERDPLLRSGIVLAGVSNAATDKRELKEDGVLTAYEAGTLNLQGTQLVVLSACETGLGEVQSGEGIYGLQRSIQLAGAAAVLTSLWRVNDTATEQLMTDFYARWLGGKPKRKAFRDAQLSLRKKYPEPQFWGAFLMVGE